MTQVLILSEADVHSLLTMGECITVMEQALAALSSGEAVQPLRSKFVPNGAPGLFGLMPAWRGGGEPYFGLKEVCVFPGNPARGLDTHLGAVLLHSGETGELLAVVNAAAVTAIRTAAVSAVATRLLARPDASRLAILGAGVQSRSHLAAIPLVRNIKQVRVYSRGGAEKLGSGVEVCATAEEAVRGADIVVTATSSKEPVLRREWLAPGCHINAVGSSVPTARELDGETVAAASLFVDRRESAVNESGDYLFAVREGAISGAGHIRAELGEVLTGQAAGRTSAEEITLFESLGLGIEDLASAAHLFEKARRAGTGTWVEF
ncbi:MAG TPA: ornithine cyclodeaminase family protein [Thermoanaerobaculia bacterium]|nr:ornithine cyclodeaminase family protein [Thermoanaerobaculia bacterium]